MKIDFTGYQEPAFSSNLLSKQPLAPVEEHTMSRNTDNLGQDGTQRATLLRESRFHQEQADQAQVRLEELQGPIDGLEIDYQNLQDTVVDLEIRNNQLMQELDRLQARNTNPNQAAQGHPGMNGVLPTPQQRRATMLRSHQNLEQEIRDHRGRMSTIQNDIRWLRAQQAQSRRYVNQHQLQFDALMHRLAPPPGGLWLLSQPLVPGAPGPGASGPQENGANGAN